MQGKPQDIETPSEAPVSGCSRVKEYPSVMKPGEPYMKPKFRREDGISSSWNPSRKATLIGTPAVGGRGTGDAAPLMMPVLKAKPPVEAAGRASEGALQKRNELNILDFEQNDEILATEDYITVQVAMDSGAIKHVTPPNCLPGGVQVKSGDQRNFQAANGGTIKNYGTAEVTLQGENQRQANCVYHVADVTRTLHATGQMCDQGLEVLHTRYGAVVVPEGHLSQFLVAEEVRAKYPRKEGGLYLAEFKVSAAKARGPPGDAATGFTRPGAAH